MFNKILHANDGSDHAFKALAMAVALAKRETAELHMVSVEEIPLDAGIHRGNPRSAAIRTT